MNTRKLPAALATLLTLALGAAAWADSAPGAPGDSAIAAQADSGKASADVKAAKGVEKREPVGEGTSFSKGEKVYIWSRIYNAKDTEIQHVWKKDGNEIWTATLPIGSNRWTTFSRRTVYPGQYEVVVKAEDGATLGSASFSVK